MTMPKRLTLLVYSLVLTLPLTAAEWSRPGTAERTDDGYLVRFELSDIPAGRFAGLEQASLSAAVQTAENGEAARAEVIPAGGGAAVAAAETIQPDKPLTFDVTPAVDRILFYGAPNDGFRLRLFAPDGRPADWELRDFTLSLTLDGEAPTPAQLPAHTLRSFPSALLPPVKEPYIFHIFAGGPPPHAGRLINTWHATDMKSFAAARPEQGALPLAWLYGPNNPHLNSEEEFIQSYENAARHYLGIHVDEWQGTRRAGAEIAETADPNRARNDKIAWSIRAIEAVKTAHPEFFVAVYWRGEDSIEPLTRQKLPDLLIMEGQSHLNKIFRPDWGVSLEEAMERLAYAKRLGMIEQTIPLFGFFENPENYHPDRILTLPELETMIRTGRERFPEMPGLAFYGSPETDDPGSGAAQLVTEAEALCWKYFIAPAPELRILAPAFHAVITAPKVEITARALPRDGRTIRRYDWFVDNRLLAQTPTEHFQLDTRLLEPGDHLLTVQAVDSGWNRSAAQLPIKVAGKAAP